MPPGTAQLTQIVVHGPSGVAPKTARVYQSSDACGFDRAQLDSVKVHNSLLTSAELVAMVNERMVSRSLMYRQPLQRSLDHLIIHDGENHRDGDQ